MSAVKYKLYCKCINTTSGKAVTNTVTKKWISAFDIGNYPNADDKNAFIKETLLFNLNGTSDEEKKMHEALIEGMQTYSNEKYDMLFVYAGQEIMYSKGSEMPYILVDKFQRIMMSPWFVHSVHASLNSVMEKAQELVKKVGHANIKIGKFVDLEQYIDIV